MSEKDFVTCPNCTRRQRLPIPWRKLPRDHDPRPVTIILAYYENAGMLARQYEQIAAYPEELREHLRLIVVDDGSPNAPAVGGPCGVHQRIYRMRVDVRWNQDACRNLAMSKATTAWRLMTDIDHLIPETTVGHLIWGKADKRKAYRFGRLTLPGETIYRPHPNTWFLTGRLFDEADGYDERFAGWYGTDGDFVGRLQRVAKAIEQRDEFIIRVPREVIPDASTTSYARKTEADRTEIARIKAERNKTKQWRTKRLSFPFDLVYESEA